MIETLFYHECKKKEVILPDYNIEEAYKKWYVSEYLLY